MHQRQKIREAVATALIGLKPGPLYATPAGPRVSKTRVFEWRASGLPAISVYTLEERVDPASATSAPTELDRRLSLVVELAAIATADPDQVIDDFCRAVEKVMHDDETFGRTCSFSILESTEIEVVASDQLVVMGRLIYAVRYFTMAPEADDRVLGPFTGATVEYKITGPTMPDADDAEDEIDPPQ